MNVASLHSRACTLFGRQLRTVSRHGWDAPTPCAEWDVRVLANHVVAEDLWTPPLLTGLTIDEVGTRFDGDVLGADPVGAFEAASGAAIAAVAAPGALARTVHLSFGDVPGEEYAWQLFVDHLIHAWDLARALDGDDRLPPDLVEAAAGWFADREDAYRAAGVIGPRPRAAEPGDAQESLLAAFGRSHRAVARA